MSLLLRGIGGFGFKGENIEALPKYIIILKNS